MSQISGKLFFPTRDQIVPSRFAWDLLITQMTLAEMGVFPLVSPGLIIVGGRGVVLIDSSWGITYVCAHTDTHTHAERF